MNKLVISRKDGGSIEQYWDKVLTALRNDIEDLDIEGTF